MGIHAQQLRETIEDVLLTAPRKLNQPQAIELMMGTAAKESSLGFYLEQLENGPALGIFEMEPDTAIWLEDALREDLAAWARSYRDDETIKWALKHRLDYQIAMVRLRYWVIPAPIPMDLAGQARYWKKFYNTVAGKGTEEEYIAAYNKYVAAR